jgi:hypothetical protein
MNNPRIRPSLRAERFGLGLAILALAALMVSLSTFAFGWAEVGVGAGIVTLTAFGASMAWFGQADRVNAAHDS